MDKSTACTRSLCYSSILDTSGLWSRPPTSFRLTGANREDLWKMYCSSHDVAQANTDRACSLSTSRRRLTRSRQRPEKHPFTKNWSISWVRVHCTRALSRNLIISTSARLHTLHLSTLCESLALARLSLILASGGSHVNDAWKRTGYCGLGRAVSSLELRSSGPLNLDFVVR